MPAGKGPFPAIILASGSGYDMRQPILTETAKALVAKGIAVYRFDWAYRVAGRDYARQPADRLAEIDDMRTALALAEHDPRVDATRIALAGKSLGSIIAWRLMRSAPEVKGAILLTPVCSRPDGRSPSIEYPELATETRPRLWIKGDVDPLCSTAAFETFALSDGKGERLAVISGDHGFETPDHPDRNPRSFDLMLRLTTDFAETLLAPAARR